MTELLDSLDSLLEGLSAKFSLPFDQVKIVIVLLLAIPLGLLNKFVRGPFARNFYSFFWGAAFQIFLYRSGILSTLSTSLALYLLMLVLPRKKCGLIVFLVSLAALSYFHIKRMIDDYGGWKMDISVAFMMFTCKYSYLAYSYTDGEIEQLPGLFEYLGFIYFYPAAVIGPTYNFVTYQQFIHLKGQYANLPSRLSNTLSQFGLGLIFAGLSSALETALPLDALTTEEYGNRNFLSKIALLHVYTLVLRFKYYTGWKLSQAGINASGISFSGMDETMKSPRFDLITTMDINFEIEHNPRVKMELWNQSVQTWLKKCVYLRVYDNNPKKATLATYSTFLVSAFWHGFYLAYYIAFIQFALIINVTRYVFKAQSKFERLPGQTALKVVRWIIANTAMNYIGGTFLLLLNDKILAFYKNFYFSVTIGMVVIQIFFMVTGWGQSSRKGKGKME